MEVIATAMVSSLGYDVRTCCAAARAGITRSAELPFLVLEDDGSPGLAVGHAATLLGGSFHGDGRLTRLLHGALSDLLSQLPAPNLSGLKIGVYLALPPVDREQQGLALIVGDEQRTEYQDDLGEPPAIDEQARAEQIAQAALAIASAPQTLLDGPQKIQASTAGHAAVMSLYEAARRDLDSGQVDLAIVAGVDSLVTESALRWLHVTHRLKSAESPAGLAPGESASCVALVSPEVAARLGKNSKARIQFVANAQSESIFLDGVPGDGVVQHDLLQATAMRSGSMAWVVTDQNGEVFRANEWGHALMRAQATDTTLAPHLDTWYPVGSFGDIGAAFGTVATCLVARAFERGYAPAPQAVILASSDGADRGACLMTAVRQ